jgi:hypothetical protein
VKCSGLKTGAQPTQEANVKDNEGAELGE